MKRWKGEKVKKWLTHQKGEKVKRWLTPRKAKSQLMPPSLGKLPVLTIAYFFNLSFSFNLLMILTNVPIIVLRSLETGSNSSCVMVSESFNSSNQYSVSSTSFKEMLSLLIKSAVLYAFLLSAIFAPILVPLRQSCFDMIYSCRSSVKYLYRKIILKAKFLLREDITFVLYISFYTFYIVVISLYYHLLRMK